MPGIGDISNLFDTSGFAPAQPGQVGGSNQYMNFPNINPTQTPVPGSPQSFGFPTASPQVLAARGHSNTSTFS